MMAPDIATMESSWTIDILNTSEGRSISFQHDTNRSTTEFAGQSELKFEEISEIKLQQPLANKTLLLSKSCIFFATMRGLAK